ncbi:MAG: GyrI-like domain-containing protein [Rhodothermaceae bacterium]
MAKTDYKKVYKELYTGKKDKPVVVEVPEFQYLMVDGKGDPEKSPEFEQAIEVLYGVSYTMKFLVKGKNPDNDYVVMPMETLWWCENMENFDRDNKDEWLWTMMISQPSFITKADVDEAVEAVKKKKELASLHKLKFEKRPAHKAVQVMHIGPYEKEEETIEFLHKFIESEGYEMYGKQLDIYLSDPRRIDPEKLKTIIRQSIK